MNLPSKQASVLEALLLATDRPLPPARLAAVVPYLDLKQVPELVDELNQMYEEGGRAFRVREVAGGYRLFTLPEYETYVDALAVTSRESRLSQAALETLAVVAYRQPVSRNDIEYVRGCDCDGVLRTLLSRRLLNIKGRSEAPGRPLLYGTTDRFLEYFGLARIEDLPDWSEIIALVGDSTPQARLILTRGAEPVPDAEDSLEEVAPEGTLQDDDKVLPDAISVGVGAEPIPPTELNEQDTEPDLEQVAVVANREDET